MAARGQPGKRGDIMRGALAVFARDGYTRASIDAISAEAGVSTRTIYNHFQDKAALFVAVVRASTEGVAEAQTAIITRHPLGGGDLGDLEAALAALAADLAAPMSGDHAEHFALVRQLDAESGHVPEEAVETWRESGPDRVQGLLAERFAGLMRDGRMRAEGADAGLAASHFLLLVRGALPFQHGLGRRGEDEVEVAVRAGVRAFLWGYGVRG
ncbi:TetR/AcrR family transcriptional regulator [Phytomonospora endophytica]|uniref:AcrR family transcriptional regulator n=1 Tax=Phytomonospora endophytica TaxID=714109 RepID=A0A841FQT6_9ACTN|nr:TetR/AcrR family transcriptional regulator [Phytomonospora endophytica]MBB6037193.1 AcrR family transcriptional regulator [Phytomonospora endophytica]GIG71233.1 TetR family transcriptional regulator [Phytomonospora endophytica]